MSEYKKYNHDLRLDGKTAIVTGGTSGIGKASAQMLAEKGANVVIVGRNPEIKDIARSLGEKVEGMRLDLRQEEEIKNVVQAVAQKYGYIDILCNSAGVPSGVPAEEMTSEEFMQVIQVNLLGAFLMAREVGKVMIRGGKGGRIINIASDAGIVAVRNHVAYSASKAGLLAVTRTLALEWGGYGITSNAISPTVVMTPMSREYWKGERAEKHIAEIPAGRFGEMDEIASAVAFLASDGAQMINGHNLVIDGGFTVC